MNINYLHNGTISSLKSVVCVVFDEHGKVLVGKSTANDIRKGKWCFPGGGIKDGETINNAAERECREETGIECNAHDVIQTGSEHINPRIVFINCRANNSKPKPNHEFTDMEWIDRNLLLKNPEFLEQNKAILQRAFD